MTADEKKRVLAEYNARHPDQPGAEPLGPHPDRRSGLPYFVALGADDSAAARYPEANPHPATDDQLIEIARRVLRPDALLPRGRDALGVRSLGQGRARVNRRRGQPYWRSERTQPHRLTKWRT